MPPIMVSTLFHDMLNFFRNQRARILLLSIIITLISTLLSYVLIPRSEQLIILSNIGNNIQQTPNLSLFQFIKKLSGEQQHIFLKASASNAISNLLGNVFLVGSLLTMLGLVSSSHCKRVSILHVITLSIPFFPRLLFLIFFMTLLIQFGFLILIIPGLLLAISLSLAPVIATSDNMSAIKSMSMSISLAFENIWLLAPAVLFWFLAKSVLLILETQCLFNSTVLVIILLNYLSNIISSLLLIYLYRLYMFLR